MNKTLRLLLIPVLLISGRMTAQSILQIPSGTTMQITGSAFLVLDDMGVLNEGSLTGTGALKLTGSSDILFFGGGSNTFDNLLINRATGSKLNLESDLQIAATVDFGGGLLNVNSSVINLGNTGILTNESELSRAYSAGPGYIEATALLNTPVDENPGGLGAIISSSANMGTTVIRRFFQSAVNSGGGGRSILRVFNIDPAFNTELGATFRFTYFDAELNGLDENSMIFWKSPDRINWSDQGSTTRNTTTNYVEKTAIDDFSFWTLSLSLNVLPVVFGNIKAIEQGNQILLQWQILTELNTVKYLVQRSSDGINYTTIGAVTAIGALSYQFSDRQPLAGNNYYRLQVIDLDNSSKLSRIVKINTARGTPGVTVYPNPASAQAVTLQFANLQKGMYTIGLFNNAGQKLYSGTINHGGGSAIEMVRFPSTLAEGIYQVKVEGAGGVFTTAVVLVK